MLPMFINVGTFVEIIIHVVDIFGSFKAILGVTFSPIFKNSAILRSVKEFRTSSPQFTVTVGVQEKGPNEVRPKH